MWKSKLIEMLNEISEDGIIMFEVWNTKTGEFDYWYPAIDEVYLDENDGTITIAM